MTDLEQISARAEAYIATKSENKIRHTLQFVANHLRNIGVSISVKEGPTDMFDVDGDLIGVDLATQVRVAGKSDYHRVYSAHHGVWRIDGETYDNLDALAYDLIRLLAEDIPSN
jgi:hypothetical protein